MAAPGAVDMRRGDELLEGRDRRAMLSDPPLVLSDVDDVGVITLTLNRPDRMKAWIPPI